MIKSKIDPNHYPTANKIIRYFASALMAFAFSYQTIPIIVDFIFQLKDVKTTVFIVQKDGGKLEGLIQSNITKDGDVYFVFLEQLDNVPIGVPVKITYSRFSSVLMSFEEVK